MSGGCKLRRPSVETLRNHARTAQLRFDNGYTSYIELPDAERSLFNAEISQVQTTGSLFQALVNLFRSMGSGWALKIDCVTGTTTGLKIYTNGYEVLYANQ